MEEHLIKIILWGTFKVYVRGVLISQKAYLNKKKQLATEEALKDITRLEAQHKVSQTDELKRRLNIEVNKLKLIEATQLPKEIMLNKKSLTTRVSLVRI